MTGSVETLHIDSAALKNNALGDPSRRELVVYLPPRYRQEGARFPVVYFLHGYAGSGPQWKNVSAFSYSPIERLDRLIGSNAIPGIIAVFVDGWTALGGSQWINSEAIGRYRDYFVQDVVGFVDRTFRTLARSRSRAVIGKSSGGYGAMVMGRHHPDIFGHLGCHAGDSYFEYCYLPDIPKAISALVKAEGLENWLNQFRERTYATRMRGEDFPVIDIIAMAAAYSPNREGPLRIDLPFELDTGRLREEVWERWLENDPVRFIPRNIDAFRRLQSIYLDCGVRDEFNIRWGTRMMIKALTENGIGVEHEEFDDGHMSINYRYDRSVTYLVPRLSRD